MEEGRNFFESEDNDEDINMIEENQSINIENINEEESMEDSVNENFLYNENEFKKDKVINFFRDTFLIYADTDNSARFCLQTEDPLHPPGCSCCCPSAFVTA